MIWIIKKRLQLNSWNKPKYELIDVNHWKNVYMVAYIRHKATQKFIAQVENNKRNPILNKHFYAADKNCSKQCEDKKLVRRKPNSMGNHIDGDENNVAKN